MRDQVLDRDRLGLRRAAVAVRVADDLAHRQAAAGEQQRAEVAPVVAAALALIRGVRPISPQTTSRILSSRPRACRSSMKRRQGVVERRAHVAHALDHRGVVDVGVHVPDEVGRDRHEAAAALAQPAGQQQQLAERLGVVDVVVVVVPLPVDRVGPDQRRRVVAGDESRVFAARSNASARPPVRSRYACSRIRSTPSTAGASVEPPWPGRRAARAGGGGRRAARGGIASLQVRRVGAVWLGSNGASADESGPVAVNRPKADDAPAASSDRRPAGRARRWSACRCADGSARRRGSRPSRGSPPNVSRPTTGLMSWLASPGTNERTIVSRSASVASRGNDAPKVTPGIRVAISPVALRIPSGAVIFGSNVSIWLGPAVQEQEDDRLAREQAGQALGLCPQRGQVGQRQPPGADRGRAADPEERRAGVRTVAVDEGEHGASSIEV